MSPLTQLSCAFALCLLTIVAFLPLYAASHGATLDQMWCEVQVIADGGILTPAAGDCYKN